MSTAFVDSAISAALWMTVKASLLLGVAAIVQALLHRRSSAATRHLLWTLAVASVLLLPILSLAVPDWTVMTRTAAPVATSVGPVIDRVEAPNVLASSSPAPAMSAPDAPMRPAVDISHGRGPTPAWSQGRGAWSWSAAIVSLYAAGVIVVLIQLAMQRRNIRRLAREAAEVRDPDWTRLLLECARNMGIRRSVALLRSRERSMPMAFGTRRPAILIPATADTWPDDRRRPVILHELAHVARYDCLTQTMAFAACALYWFHPAAWWVARRLRIERELACDDRVLAAGTRARQYAGHLLEIAYSLGTHRAPALAVSMARPRQLESRMLAVLDAARNRSVPAGRMRLAGTAIAAALLLPLAGAQVTVVASPDAESTPATLSTPQPRAADEAPGVAQDKLPGTWEIRPSSTEGTVHLRLVEEHSSSGSNVPIDRLEGLMAAQISGASGPVQFRLRRDAGTLTFEGVFRNGVGAGTFSFMPDPNFPAELVKRGVGRPTAQQQYQLARHDVGYAFLDELNKQGYAKSDVSELVRAGQHGVHLSYLREMGALGYRLGSLEPLIKLRDHGVTPTYVRELAAQGYKGLSADGLREARDHGVSPEYVRAMRDAGYGSLTMEQLIKARDHGVSPEFVRGLGEAGHRKLPLEQLIRVRDHGVSPEYAREMRQLGHPVSIDELVRARDHGVSVEFVRAMESLGYSKLSLDTLVQLRDHGVSPKYVEELKALGYDRLPVADLVTLRDHGLTPDRIRAANARAGTRLPVDLLKSLR
jgi:beta-lactamase regulating signal transducer with metallopeptidase domain